MLTYNCESTEVETLLQRMESLARGAGASFSDRMVICEKNGELWVETTGEADPDTPLMVIPEECLSPVEEVDLALDGDDLVIRDIRGDWSPTRREMFECMIALYNMGGKIAAFRATSPKVAFLDHPELQARLLGAHTDQLLIGLRDEYQRGGADLVAINGFLRSRTAGHRSPATGESYRCLTSFIDLLNHDLAGAPYQSVPLGKQVMEAKCVPGSDQCFAQYGIHGALDTYIIYGFVDIRAGLVRSAPITIELPELGNIEILANQAGYLQRLPDNLVDLQPYFPAMNRIGNTVQLSRLIIPDTHRPRALVRVLMAVISNLVRDLNVTPHPDSLKLAEAQVILKNHKFFSELKEYLGDPNNVAGAPEPALAEARKAAAHQLARLSEYHLIA